MANTILVFCEATETGLKKGALELLSLAKNSGQNVNALVVGPKGSKSKDLAAHYGAKTVWHCDDAQLDNYNPEVFTNLFCDAIKDSGAKFVLATSSLLARDLFPRVAARLDSGVASDCTSLEITATSLKARRPLYAGKCSAEVEFVDSPVQIVLMRPNQIPLNKPDTANKAEFKSLALKPVDTKTTAKETVRGQVGKVDLTEANIIVSGGRGMKGPEHFKLLDDLAGTIGGTVGASRAVADAGWVPHSMQVGQTGKTVAPTLYIACGISGAIQHLAGMSGSKVIVAINKDPEAPIFQKANYGVVGDLFEVVPKLTEEFRHILKS